MKLWNVVSCHHSSLPFLSISMCFFNIFTRSLFWAIYHDIYKGRALCAPSTCNALYSYFAVLPLLPIPVRYFNIFGLQKI